MILGIIIGIIGIVFACMRSRLLLTSLSTMFFLVPSASRWISPGRPADETESRRKIRSSRQFYSIEKNSRSSLLSITMRNSSWP